MSKCSANSTPSGTRYGTKNTHLPLRSATSIEDISKLPVAFDVVSMTGSATTGEPSPAPSRSFTAYEEMMRNDDQARAVSRTCDSLAELRAFPSISKEPDAQTVNKRLHSAESKEDVRNLPELPVCYVVSRSSSSMGGEPSLGNSDYAYYPPVLRNSDYVYTGNNTGENSGLTPTNSSYCYVNADGTTRLASACPVRQAKSPANPYATVSRYRMDRSEPADSYVSLVGSERIPSDVYLPGGYERDLPPPRAPNTATLNKKVRGSVTVEDLSRVEVTWSGKCTGEGSCPAMSTSSDFGCQVIRDFCRESLEDLRALPNLSTYCFDQPETDVYTARSIRSFGSETSGVKTAVCTCPSPSVTTARSATSDDGFKYYPEAMRPRSRR